MKIGIDIGGNHIAVAIVEKDEIINKKEYEIKNFINNNNEYNIKNYILNILIDSIHSFNFDKKDLEKIGISCCGTIKNGTIIKAPNLKVVNFDLVNLLKEEFQNVEISLRNDAKCAALAEKEYGILKQYEDAIFLTVGTGIGGATFINNKFLEPIKNSGFEFGHMVINYQGKTCDCGSCGCFERYASITALKELVKEEFNISGELTGKELYKFLFENINNIKVYNIIDEYTNYLALGISNIVNIFEPEIIVLSGSIVFYEDMLLEKIKNKLYIFNRENGIPELKMSVLKNDAGVLGALL